jgi:hypothetical protein
VIADSILAASEAQKLAFDVRVDLNTLFENRHSFLNSVVPDEVLPFLKQLLALRLFRMSMGMADLLTEFEERSFEVR